MFGFYWTDINGAGYFPRFFGANLSRAKFQTFKIFAAVPEEVEARHRGPGNVPGDVLPISYASVARGYSGVPVQGWKGRYVITSYEVGSDFHITGAVPPEMWRSMYAGLNSLASARNWSDADMPLGLSGFMSTNQSTLSKPIISTTCSDSLPTALSQQRK
jgi:hypothetical protein